ncbi:GGDEF domain-containing protein [Jiella sp. M17.18]|uniref:GGDEF domain-containing protein n=1 Tax=Jiella sp. M17.18 TaxID=3234247 RepID=UPI0034DE3EA8
MYIFMQRIGWPRSYVGKIIAICFVGTHVPLIALVGWTLSRGDFVSALPILGVALAATLVGTGLTIAGVAGMLQPIAATTEALDRYAAERQRPDLPSAYDDVAGRLMASVQSTVLDLDRTLGDLEAQTVTDPLTGLNNRRWLHAIGADMVEDARTGGGDLSLLVIDVDGFKQLNDTYGHISGDRALIVVADAIRSSVRDGDEAVRIGGDEFCVLLPDADREAAAEIGRRIRETARRSVDDFLGAGALTLSVGAATLARSDRVFEDLYRRADERLYQAKSDGRDRLVLG